MKILLITFKFIVFCISAQFSTIENYSFKTQQYYSIGNIICTNSILANNNEPFKIAAQFINNNDEELGSLFCNDVWRTFSGPINGGILGKVCVVNNSYFCQNTYYKSSDIIGTGQCISEVD